LSTPITVSNDAHAEPQWFNWDPMQWFSEPEDRGELPFAASQSLVVSRKYRGDVVQLGEGCAPHAQLMRHFYGRCGLDVTDSIVDNLTPTDLPDGFNYRPLVANAAMAPSNWLLRPDAQRWCDLIARIKSKDQFDQYVRQHGFSDRLPKSITLPNGTLPTPDQLANLGFAQNGVWVKEVEEQFGEHPVVHCTTLEELERTAANLRGALQFQEHVHGPDWNTVYHALPGRRLLRMGTSQQLIVGSKHVGNVRPTRTGDDGGPLCDDIAFELVRDGILGDFAIDSKGRTHVIEGNHRVNGQHPAWEVAGGLGHEAFYYRFFHGESHDLEAMLDILVQKGHAYSPRTRKGVIPIVWGFVPYNGSGSLLALGDKPEEVFNAAAADLKIS
jgi:hypothetical protein